MLTVKKIGERRIVTNPVDQKQTEMQVVTFTENGRSGLSESLSSSSAFLDRILNVQTGLDSIRTHTQLVTLDAVAKLKEGQEIPGHINRKLSSFATMRQQQDVEPRLVDGRPTFVYTELSDQEHEDVDNRISNEALLNYNGGSILFSAKLGGTEVRVVKNPSSPMSEVIKETV